jgi:hypothetical protein
MRSGPASALRAIRLLHTVVWAVLAGIIVAIPVFAWQRRFTWALVLIGIVLVEVAVLVANRMRCPLTDVAGRYTDDRSDNFDIYLPLWLARHNKVVFGSLFAGGLVLTIVRWLT